MMSHNFTKEKEMEDKLIAMLQSECSYWQYCPELNTEDKLWENFFDLLEKRNTKALDGVMLTDQEKRAIQSQLDFTTSFKAAEFIRGENGVSQIPLQREDSSLGMVTLKVMSAREIAGGDTTYQIINQYQSKKTDPKGQNARFDVTLMINGLPMIHIELKNRSTSYMDAFYQIQRYQTNGKFHGIFSLVQMFVVTNGTDTKYIAAAEAEKMRPKFLTGWVKADNTPVRDYMNFAREVLTIPMAHNMVANYSVLDYDSQAIILLRPYQVHALEAIRHASSRNESGYVWHTTGSGKTLTSYKAARNLLDIASMEKTIFIVDRVDLDQQTTSAFQSYSQDDYVNVEETDNVSDLINKLASKDRTVVVTTIQKLNYVLDRYNRDPDNQKLNRVKGKKVAFVVDECHRAVTPQKQQELNKFFHRALWYGFTGTPIFKENAHKEFGDLARTTQEQYGDCLHEYTVKEAIHDQAVLGFQIEYNHTISEGELDLFVEKELHYDPLNMEAIDIEKLLPQEIYEQSAHMEQVVNYIVNKAQKKLGLSKGVGKSYDSILTTTSIAQAIKYYDLIQEVKRDQHSNVKIGKATREQSMEFPKVAITYSLTDNEGDSVGKQEAMKRALDDYNDMFGTNFTLETIRMYNRDLNQRLARKSKKYLSRSEQLDLVIVVDRLLTGFDAPCMSTLFIDRPPMPPHHMIQAFSRTNRIFDEDKRFGQIVTFQTPALYEQAVVEALYLYSNGGENEIQAPSWETSQEIFEESFALFKQIAPNVEAMNALTEPEAMRQAASAFQRFDKAWKTMQVYSQYDEENFVNTYGIDVDEYENYIGAYNNLIDRLRAEEADDENDFGPDFDIDYSIETAAKTKIDYKFITVLIDRVKEKEIQSNRQGEPGPKEEEYDEITSLLQSIYKEKPKQVAEIMAIFDDIRKNPESYEHTPTLEVIQSRFNEIKHEKIKTYADENSLDEDAITYVVDQASGKSELGKDALTDILIGANYDEYKAKTNEPLTKLKYRKKIKTEAPQYLSEEVLPYDI